MGIKRVSLLDEWQRELSRDISAAIGGEAEGMVSAITAEEDLGDIVADFQKYFATPMMQMFQEEIVPIIKEGYNLPGAYYSTARSAGVARAGEEFMTERISPALFQTIEGYRQRQVQRAQIGAGVLGVGAGLATTPTYQAFQTSKKKSGLGGAIGGAIGLGIGAAFPGAGEALGGLSTFEMGSLGALFGGAF